MMQYQYPELLYALVLLAIPILIHLFQLRRFQKEAFTNVKFLRIVKLQTRKSSQIKKWLTLLTRCLVVACLVLAFSQPYIPNSEAANKVQELVIFIDNSHSMEAKGNNGSLLNEVLQDLMLSLPEDKPISLFTNTKTYKNTTLKAIKNELINLNYSSNQLSYDAAFLKGQTLFSNKKNRLKQLILVSDFQQKNKALAFPRDSFSSLYLVQPKAVNARNISIDSVYATTHVAETIELNVDLSSNSNTTIENCSVSLLNNAKLLAKSSVAITDKRATLKFNIPNNQGITGKLIIEDNHLQYDNSLFFSTNTLPKIKVLAISKTVDANFLERIYTKDEFDFKALDLKTLNYSSIPQQHLIVLNELPEIPQSLATAVRNFKNNGGSIVVIPASNITMNSYNALLKNIGTSIFTKTLEIPKHITKINYNHSLLSNTFYNKVVNFQYPKVSSSYQFSNNSKGVLLFEDSTPFLKGDGKTFCFAAPINDVVSNFKNSQLIVPVFYNIGVQSLPLSKLYYNIDTFNQIAVTTSTKQDDVLSIGTSNMQFIPLQKKNRASVVIQTKDLPNKAGTYGITLKDSLIQNISYNYKRDESNLSYHDLEILDNISSSDSLSLLMDTLKNASEVNALWKWFIIFALGFLIIEMLILKYL